MSAASGYPEAERLDLVEEIHGQRVADPYRWLEDATSPATRAWSAAQEQLWQRWAATLPARAVLRARLRELVPGYTTAPQVVGERRFWMARAPDQDHAVLWVADAAGVRALVDPNALSPDGTVTLDGWAPSLEGDRLAYQLSSGGDEESRIWVVDVASGGILDGPIDRARYSPMAWLPGGRELVYVRRLPAEAVPEGEAQYHRRVYRHRIADGLAGPGASGRGACANGTEGQASRGDGRDGGVTGDPVGLDAEIFGAGIDMTAYFGVDVAPSGAWIAVTTSLGTAPRDDLHLLRLDDPAATWRAVVVGSDARVGPHLDRRGDLWLLTDLDASLGRLCVVAPGAAELGPAHWREVVAEDPDGAVLEDFVLAGAHLVVLWRRHAISEITVHDRGSGALLRRVDLPGAGSADLTGRVDEGPDVWVGYTDHTTPYQVLSLDVAAGSLMPAGDPVGPTTATGTAATGTAAAGTAATAGTAAIVSGQIVATSADGTDIRLTVVAGAATPDRPRPTVLYGYGGFDISLTPAYSSSIRAWVEAGGVWVVAHLRGGSEEGERWHREGMRQHKHHVFEDFEAAADALVEGGWTTRGQLGIFGGSNGGLLVGAALTRCPRRYTAVICSAPLLDMVRYEQFGLGATWNDEYGTAADPTELAWLLEMSPYHHVQPGVAYPAILFTVFEGDSRVDPLHARKLAAALQWATTSDPQRRPVLVRSEVEVGHGARSLSRTVELAADQLAFFGDQLGLDLPLTTLV